MNTRRLRLSSLTVAFAFALAFLPCSVPAQAPLTRGPAAAEEPVAVPYRITRGDKLAIAVFDEADLSAGNKRVEASGTINLMLVGDVRVHGMTLAEAARAIEAAYQDGRFLRKPQVTVTVEEYSPRTVLVTGKVKYPGKVSLPPDEQTTIKDVIMKVGGFDDTARGTAVRLTRILPDGSHKIIHLDVQSALIGKEKGLKSGDASFVVEPEDTIYVPEKII